MDLHLQPQAGVCFVTGTEFQEDDRVVSFLVKNPAGEFLRYDCLESAEAQSELPGNLLCRWVRRYKVPEIEVNPEKELKVTAESLFLSLTVDSDDPPEENASLKQFLALMLERKRILKNRGQKEGEAVTLYEHRPSRQIIEVPIGEMDTEFFVGVQEKLGVLVGEPEKKKEETEGHGAAEGEGAGSEDTPAEEAATGETEEFPKAGE